MGSIYIHVCNQVLSFTDFVWIVHIGVHFPCCVMLSLPVWWAYVCVCVCVCVYTCTCMCTFTGVQSGKIRSKEQLLNTGWPVSGLYFNSQQLCLLVYIYNKDTSMHILMHTHICTQHIIRLYTGQGSQDTCKPHHRTRVTRYTCQLYSYYYIASSLVT